MNDLQSSIDNDILNIDDNKMIKNRQLELPPEASIAFSSIVSRQKVKSNLTKSKIIYFTKNSAYASTFWITLKNFLQLLGCFNTIIVFFYDFGDGEGYNLELKRRMLVLNTSLFCLNSGFILTILVSGLKRRGLFDGSLDGFQGIKIGNFDLKGDYKFDSSKFDMENKDFCKLREINERTLATLDFGDNHSQLDTIKRDDFWSSQKFINFLTFFFNFNYCVVIPFSLVRVDFFGVEKIVFFDKEKETFSSSEVYSGEEIARTITLLNLILGVSITLYQKFFLATSFPNFENKSQVLSKGYDSFLFLLEMGILVALKIWNFPVFESTIPNFVNIALCLILAFCINSRPNYLFSEIQFIENFTKIFLITCCILKEHIIPNEFYNFSPDFFVYRETSGTKFLEYIKFLGKDTDFFLEENLLITRWRVVFKVLIIGLISFLTAKNLTYFHYDFSFLSFKLASKLDNSVLARSKFLMRIISLLRYSLELEGTNFNFPGILNFVTNRYQNKGELVVRGLVKEHRKSCIYLNCSCKKILIDMDLHKMKSNERLRILTKDFDHILGAIRNILQAASDSTSFDQKILIVYCYFLTDFQNRPLQARKIMEFKVMGEEPFFKFFFKYYQHQKFKTRVNRGSGLFNRLPPLNLKNPGNQTQTEKLAVKKIFQFGRLLSLFKLNMNCYLKVRELIYKELMMSEVNLKDVLSKSVKVFSMENWIENMFDIYEELSGYHMPNFLVYECFYQVRVKFNHFMKEGLVKNLRLRLKEYFKERSNIPFSLFKSYLESKTCIVTTAYSPLSNSFSKIVYCTRNTDLIIGHSALKLKNSDISIFLPNGIRGIHNQFLRTSMAFQQKTVHCAPTPAYVRNSDKQLLKVSVQISYFCDLLGNSKIQIFSFISRKKLQDESYLIMIDKSGYIKGASKAAIEFFGFENRTLEKGKLGINYLAKEFDLLISGLNWKILLGLAGEKDKDKEKKDEEGKEKEKGKKGSKKVKDFTLPRVLPLFFEKQDISLMNKMRGFFDNLLEKAGRKMYIEYRDPNRKVLKESTAFFGLSPPKERIFGGKKKKFKGMGKTGKLDLTEFFDEKDLEIVEGLFRMNVIEMILPTFTIIRVIELKKISKSLTQYKKIIDKMRQGNLTMADQMKFGLNGDEGMIDPQKNFIISVDKSICMMKRRNKKTPKELKYLQTDLIEGEMRFQHCNFTTDFNNIKDVKIVNEYWEQLIASSKAFQKCLFVSFEAKKLAFQRVSSRRRLSIVERSMTKEGNNNTIVSTQSRTNRILMSDSRAGTVNFKIGFAANMSQDLKNRNLDIRDIRKKREHFKNKLQVISKKLYNIYRGKFKARNIFNAFFTVMFTSLFLFTLVCITDQVYLRFSSISYDKTIEFFSGIKQLRCDILEYNDLSELIVLEYENLRYHGLEEIEGDGVSFRRFFEITDYLIFNFYLNLEKFEISYLDLKAYENYASIDLELDEIEVPDTDIRYKNIAADGNNGQKSLMNIFKITQKLRTSMLASHSLIKDLELQSKNSVLDVKEELIEGLKNSTIVSTSLTTSSYSPFLQKLSDETYHEIEEQIDYLRYFFLVSSLTKLALFLLPYILISLKIISYQKKISRTFKIIKNIDNDNLAKLIDLNTECKRYCNDVDKGFSTEPLHKLKINIKEDYQPRGDKGQPEKKREARKSIFANLDVSKNKKNDSTMIKGKDSGRSSAGVKKSGMVVIPQHVRLEALDDKSSHFSKKKRIEIENFGGIHKENKIDKEGDEFFTRIVQGIFKKNGPKSLIKPQKSFKRNHKSKAIRHQQGQIAKGRVIISRIKANGYEDFGLRTYFFFIILLVLFTSIPLITFYFINSKGIDIMAALCKIGEGSGRLRVDIRLFMDTEVNLYYANMLGFNGYYKEQFGKFDEYFEFEYEDYQGFKDQLKTIESDMIKRKRVLDILASTASNTFGIGAFVQEMLGIEEKINLVKSNYYFGKENICTAFGQELAQEDITSLYGVESSIEFGGKVSQIITSFEEKKQSLENLTGVDSFFKECVGAFKGNFDKSWQHFESNLKLNGYLALESLMKEKITEEKFHQFYKKSDFFKTVLSTTLFVKPILKMEYQLLQLKNVEMHSLINFTHLNNSFFLLLILLIIQLFLFNFVKNSLEKSFKAHQLFLSLFDLEVIRGKKVLKQYLDYYDSNVGKSLYDVYWHG